MRWDVILQAITSRMAADSTLQSIYGEAIRKEGVHKFTVPSLDYVLISFTQNELWEPHIIQFNQYTKNLDDQARSERALTRLFNHDNVIVIEGIAMWCVLEDGGDLTGPETEGYYGIASRYRFTPIREKLVNRPQPEYPEEPEPEPEPEPEEPAIWRERFETPGYENVWSEGETVGIVGGNLPTLDSESPPPSGAPSSWGSSCLLIGHDETVVNNPVNAYVQHDGLEVPSSRTYDVTLDFMVVSEALVNGGQFSVLRFQYDDAGVDRFPFLSLIRRGNGANGLNVGVLGFAALVRASGVGAGSLTTHAVEIEVGVPYQLRFLWDQIDKTYDLQLDGESFGSGLIQDDPATEQWAFNDILLGIVNNQVSGGTLVYAVDNLNVIGEVVPS